MSRDCPWFALLIVALAAPPAAAAAPSESRAVAPSRRAPRASEVTRERAPADTSARSRPRVAPRTLDDIHIAGEIPVPQVLFITARDQRRFLEFQHHRYQRSSLELGRATATPSRVVVTAPAPVERKEIQR